MIGDISVWYDEAEGEAGIGGTEGGSEDWVWE